MRTISKEKFLEFLQLVLCATLVQFKLWFLGRADIRFGRGEKLLPRLVRQGGIRAVKYGSFYVYFAPKWKREDHQYPESIAHGLGVTEGLVRVWRSDMTGTIIPSRFFRGLGAIPEWGIRYDNNTILLYEFSRHDNFYQRLTDKIYQYRENLDKIGAKFNARLMVLFVLDVERKYLTSWINRYSPAGPFVFTDYATFKSVTIGQQLTSEIYLWGESGQPLSLRHV